MRQFNLLDKVVNGLDMALRTLIVPEQRQSSRMNPAREHREPLLSVKEKRHVAGLMRVNHAGEVCAQALYQGQALTAKLPTVKTQMVQAALEEVEHLAWCEQRLRELNSQPSKLNFFWYSGAFMIGALAGLVGDRWSLGFVAETERQVAAHLQKHLRCLPAQDTKSQAILTRMHSDEAQHAEAANAAGAMDLPFLIKQAMRATSKLMTCSSYYI